MHHHPYNQERAINLSILSMSGIQPTTAEATAPSHLVFGPYGSSMVFHPMGLARPLSRERPPRSTLPTALRALRWPGRYSWLTTGSARVWEASPVPAGVAPIYDRWTGRPLRTRKRGLPRAERLCTSKTKIPLCQAQTRLWLTW